MKAELTDRRGKLHWEATGASRFVDHQLLVVVLFGTRLAFFFILLWSSFISLAPRDTTFTIMSAGGLVKLAKVLGDV